MGPSPKQLPARWTAAALAALAALGCTREDRPAAGAPAPVPPAWTPVEVPPEEGDLVDEAVERGLDYLNRSGETSKSTVLEANGAGVAVIDLGGDGDLDLVFAQGLPSLQALVQGPGADLEVFENDGSGRFQRVPGPGLSGWWNGLAVGDLDGDGLQDLVAGGFGGLHVVLQQEGRLEAAPWGDLLAKEPRARLVPGEAREPGAPPAWFTSLALFDADRDGNLDLYAGQYLDLDPVEPPLGRLGEGPLAVPCRWKGHEVFCGPRGMSPQSDRIYRGSGTGRFTDVTARWFPDQVAGYTLAVAPFDADGDGDTDLYVANDSSPNLLLVNDGHGRFTDVAYSAGVALSPDGAAEAGMGISVGDVDRDGRFDLAVTNFSGEPTALYLGAQVGFKNETFRMGLMRASRDLLSWGVHLADLDGDGWLELFTANGHVYPQADLPDTGTSYGQRDTLWRLGPARRAERVEPRLEGSLLAPVLGSRGSALGDFDGDGAPDLVVTRIDGPAALAMNRLGKGRQRLVLRLLGPRRGEPQTGAAAGRTPADAMGARVVVVCEPLPGTPEHALFAEVQTSTGYQSASTAWLHFGLDAVPHYRSIRVLWPSGRVEELPGGPANRRLTVREGEGVIATELLR